MKVRKDLDLSKFKKNHPLHDPVYNDNIFFEKLNSLTPQQMAIYNSMCKKTSTAVLLAAFLGGFGGHRFYLDNNIGGIFSILFCWTLIPAIAGLLFIPLSGPWVRTYNVKLLKKITGEE